MVTNNFNKDTLIGAMIVRQLGKKYGISLGISEITEIGYLGNN